MEGVRHPAEILSESVVRDYLERHGLFDCLESFNKARPITQETDTTTYELVESLRLSKYFKRNQSKPKNERFLSLLEIMSDFFCLPFLKEGYQEYINELSKSQLNQYNRYNNNNTNNNITNSQKDKITNNQTHKSQTVKITNSEVDKIPEPPSLTSNQSSNLPDPAKNKNQPSILPDDGVSVTYKAPDGTTFKDLSVYRQYLMINYYTFENKKNETLRKTTGEVDGQPFKLDHLNGCNVEILDYSSTVTCDYVIKSTICFGPIRDSIFIRNCENCTFYICTKQLRTRDCNNCIIYLYCMTDPIIETSYYMQFAPFKLSYPLLNEHSNKAGFDVDDNHWRNIFDFNKDDKSIPSYHWQLLDPSKYEQKVIQIGETPPENPFGLEPKVYVDTLQTFSIDQPIDDDFSFD